MDQSTPQLGRTSPRIKILRPTTRWLVLAVVALFAGKTYYNLTLDGLSESTDRSGVYFFASIDTAVPFFLPAVACFTAFVFRVHQQNWFARATDSIAWCLTLLAITVSLVHTRSTGPLPREGDSGGRSVTLIFIGLAAMFWVVSVLADLNHVRKRSTKPGNTFTGTVPEAIYWLIVSVSLIAALVLAGHEEALGRVWLGLLAVPPLSVVAAAAKTMGSTDEPTRWVRNGLSNSVAFALLASPLMVASTKVLTGYSFFSWLFPFSFESIVLGLAVAIISISNRHEIWWLVKNQKPMGFAASGILLAYWCDVIVSALLAFLNGQRQSILDASLSARPLLYLGPTMACIALIVAGRAAKIRSNTSRFWNLLAIGLVSLGIATVEVTALLNDRSRRMYRYDDSFDWFGLIEPIGTFVLIGGLALFALTGVASKQRAQTQTKGLTRR